MPYNLKDADLIVTKALPATDGAVNTDAIDLGAPSARADLVAGCELLVEAPALTTTELPDADTMTYKVEMDTTSAFSSATTLADSLILQTGAGGAGAAAASARLKLPTDCERYIRVVATGAGGIGDASGKSVTASLCT